MSQRDTTTSELRKNAVAALWMLAVVTVGAFVLAAMF
jgi:hypothetical protein